MKILLRCPKCGLDHPCTKLPNQHACSGCGCNFDNNGKEIKTNAN